MVWVYDDERLKIGLLVLTNRIHKRDGQTDGRTDAYKQAHAA